MDFLALNFWQRENNQKNIGSQIIRLCVELGITDTHLSTLFLHMFTLCLLWDEQAQDERQNTARVFTIWPPHHKKSTWDPPNKAGSRNLQQPERWAPWQKSRQIVCLPSDKQNWYVPLRWYLIRAFVCFGPKHGTTSPALISGELLKSKWRILWRFQEKYRHSGQLSFFRATQEAVTQCIMACLGCQQSHTGPGQKPAWALWVHYITEAKAHQLHSKQQTGEGCCYHTRLALISQTGWNSDTFQWDVPAVSWFSGSRANYFSCSAVLSMSCPFCLPDKLSFGVWKHI